MESKNETKALFNRIDASLRYGIARLPKPVLILLYIFIIFAAALTVIFILIAVFDVSLNFIYAAAASFVVTAILVIVFLRFYRLKLKIKLWLQDAVEIKAKCTALGKRPPKEEVKPALAVALVAVSLAAGAPVTSESDNWPNSRIIITFKYNGKAVKRMSGKQGYSDDEMETGRSYIFKKYINKEIDILYSPKYDQVLIVKQKEVTN